MQQAIERWLGMATAYQQQWWADRHKKHRHYCNARQVGTTMAMAIEGRAMREETGRPQVFVSASIGQASIFQLYQEGWFLDKGADQYFLSPRCIVPDCLVDGSADVYVDCYRWLGMDHFSKVRTMAETLAGVDGRITWLNSGELAPISYDPVAFRFWRDDAAKQSLTIHDAVAGGLTTVSVDYLRSCYQPDDFARSFECRIP